ncbi:MAG: acetolactate synthase small subunit [Candidatus Aquicultor primus]|uniref:Acetolactate synthase small subunit n=1 Tax=Candidatus Aquicultor primus TaxID=1797195 RepID=A0A1F2UNH0_9ACTN|nr:MAG: acetolactate synthase small subunit [Candidatus Aquicultor primus]
MKHILSVLVENKPGVLARVSGLFSRRGFNIDSLAVGPTEDADISRMTIVVDADDVKLEQITKQLYKLINILKISDLDPSDAVERELVLIKVNAPPNMRPEIVETANIFRANIIDVSKSTLTIEITGTSNKIQALEDLLRPYGIKELVRTGKVALARGKLAEV